MATTQGNELTQFFSVNSKILFNKNSYESAKIRALRNNERMRIFDYVFQVCITRYHT